MDFPTNPPEALSITEGDVKSVIETILTPQQVTQVEKVLLSAKTKKLVFKMNNDFTRSDLENLAPDFNKMLSSHDGSVFKGVIVTTAGDESSGLHFLSRYFAPWNGIPEDPVSGSAHTVLAPYWSTLTQLTTMRARQCSKRGGNLIVTVREDGRTEISGQATMVIRGTIDIPC